MQAKDVDAIPVLRLLDSLHGEWAYLFEHHERSVLNAMPADTPPKVAQAKMRGLIRRGLVDGCGCGCRVDFTITAKGRALVTGETQETCPTRVQVSG